MPGAGRVTLPLSFPSAWSSIKTLVNRAVYVTADLQICVASLS
ncbi:hypothetical protein FOXYSP1_16799 [Fusarium oxysporum f. sp. phaseoli]